MPGAYITVTKDTVLYADWVATTYDIGQYNSYVTDTVSTKDFITTKVFDYSSLINLLSSKVSVNVSGSSHSETWSHVASGNVSVDGNWEHAQLIFSLKKIVAKKTTKKAPAKKDAEKKTTVKTEKAEKAEKKPETKKTETKTAAKTASKSAPKKTEDSAKKAPEAKKTTKK